MDYPCYLTQAVTGGLCIHYVILHLSVFMKFGESFFYRMKCIIKGDQEKDSIIHKRVG